jgi:hypothetical protein
VDIVSNFNKPNKPIKFIKNNGICFLVEGLRKNPRYFFPSPQEDIDLYNSLELEYVSGRTENSEGETVYSSMKKITDFEGVDAFSLKITNESLPFINEYRKKHNPISYRHEISESHYGKWVFINKNDGSATYNDSSVDEEITLDKFKELTGLIEKPIKIESKMVTITREQLKEIHDIACSTWKDKIKNIAKEQPFGDIELSDTQVQEMRDAATDAQKPTIEKIFGKELEEIDFTKIRSINDLFDGKPLISFGGGDNCSLITPGIMNKDQLFLNPKYNYELVIGFSDVNIKVSRK